MIVLRVLLLLTIVALLVWAWRRIRGPQAGTDGQEAFERTETCASCGAHIARRLAVQSDGRHYCPEHAP